MVVAVMPETRREDDEEMTAGLSGPGPVEEPDPVCWCFEPSFSSFCSRMRWDSVDGLAGVGGSGKGRGP